MRTALLTSSKRSKDLCEAFKYAAPVLPSMGMLTIASNLEKHNYKDIHIYDADLENCKSPEEIFDWLKKVNPDVIGITVFTCHVQSIKNLLEKTKTEFPGIPTIGGGPHCSVNYEKAMRELPFDYVCVGEGENTMVEFLDHLKGLRSIETIKGLAYRKNGDITFNGNRPLEEDLDNFPFPAYHLIRKLIPRIRPQIMGYKKKPLMLLISSRGCPYSCGFCTAHITWKRKFRAHSAEYLVEMIEYFIDKYDIREFTFMDDTFLLDKKRVSRFCDLLIEKKITIYWSANINIAHVTEKMANKMRRAGCWYVSTGIESGNDDILKFLGKPLTVKVARNNLEILKKNNILCRGYFVIGLLKETKETIDDTVRMILDVPLYVVQISIYSVYEGSCWYNSGQSEKHGTVYPELVAVRSSGITGNASKINFVGRRLTAEFLIKKQAEAYRRFFFRFSQVYIILKNVSTKEDISKIVNFSLAGIYYLFSKLFSRAFANLKRFMQGSC